MAFTPSETAAAARIPQYNNSDYDGSGNPYGMGDGGHLVNFYLALGDAMLMGQAALREATNAGLNFLGSWSNVTNYAVSDGVYYNGSTFRAIASGVNHPPPTLPTISNTWWHVVAAVGEKGDAGDSATMEIDSTVTLDAGEDALVENLGTDSAALLKFSIPRGAVGDPGDDGAPGLAATIGIDGVDTLTAGSSATVTNEGTSNAASFRFGIPRGADGSTGPAGPVIAPVWNYSTTTTDSDPGSGNVRLNNATLAAASFIYIDPLMANGANAAAWIEAIDESSTPDNKGAMRFTKASDASVFAEYRVIGTITIASGYYKIPVAYVTGNGSLSDTNPVAIAFTRTGDVGASGGGAGDVTTSGAVASGHYARFADASGDVIEDGGELSIVAITGAYEDLIDPPDFSTVAMTGNWGDIVDKPAFGTAALLDTGTGAGNIPLLDGDGKILSSVLPSIAITSVSVVASQSAMLALTAQEGDVAIRSDVNKTFILSTGSAATLGNWKELPVPADVVLSVAGLTGSISASSLKSALSLVLADISDMSANGRSLVAMSYSSMRTALSINSVDNTSDAGKPVSTAQQTALDLKSDKRKTIINETTAARTLSQSDEDALIHAKNSGLTTFTIPANATQAIAIGSTFFLKRHMSNTGGSRAVMAAGTTYEGFDATSTPFLLADSVTSGQAWTKIGTNDWTMVGGAA